MSSNVHQIWTGPTNNSARNPFDFTADDFQENFTDTLRKFVGYRKPWNRTSLSEATGIEIRTIDAWLSGKSVANGFRLTRLRLVIGEEFWNALWEHSDPVECDLATSLDVNAKATALSAKIGQDMQDGSISHIEEAEQDSLIRELLVTAQGWLDRRKKARRS